MKTTTCWLAAAVCAAYGVASTAQDPPREWIEPSTGHRVVRLSNEPGTASLYFHQNPYTATGDKMVVSTPRGLATIALETRSITPLVEGRVSHLVVGRKSRQAFYIQNDTVFATHLDTGATRKILVHPRIRTGSGFGVSADETHLAGSFVVEGAPATQAPGPAAGGNAAAANPLATPPPTASSLERRWAARLPMALYTLNVSSGELKIIYQSNDWLNHVQMSPTDPGLIMFCHEGPWHFVDRIWTIKTNGEDRMLRHKRTMDMEIAGHEFFGADGRTIWYDLQTPKSKVFWLAGVDVASGRTFATPSPARNGRFTSTCRPTAGCSRATAADHATSRHRETGSGFICSGRPRAASSRPSGWWTSRSTTTARAERHLHTGSEVDHLPLEHARRHPRVCRGSGDIPMTVSG